MQVEVTRKMFTVDEYHRMGEAGILTPEDRVELIEGEILQMSPIGNRHAACVDRAAKLLILRLQDRAVISIQNPVRLDRYSEPQPDVLVLKPRDDFYASTGHTAADVLLMIEVSETTLRYDTQRKVPLYAAAGVPEVWIEDLNNDVILVYREPSGNTFQTTFECGSGETIEPLAFPDVALVVNDLLGN
jgi:Uma2 family endonuclease